MSDIVGEARIVLNADTALLIKQIEALPAIPFKVRPVVDKRAVAKEMKELEISPDFRLTTKAHENLRATIRRAIIEASKESKVFLLTGARFELGKASQKSIFTSVRNAITEASKLDQEFKLTNTRFGIGAATKASLVKNIKVAVKEATAIVNADPTGLIVKIDKGVLDADAVAAASGARKRMQLIFAKPIMAFVNADISGAVGAFSRLEVVSKRIFKSIGLAWGLTTAAIVAGTVAIGASAVVEFGNLEQSATNAASLIGGEALTRQGATTEKATKIFNDAKKQFIEGALVIAKTTSFSAKEAADGYYFLASAGESAKNSLALLPDIAKFAQAGQFDLQQSTEGLLQSFNALGLNIGTFQEKRKNIRRLTDELTNANIRSITDLQELSDALKNRAAASFTQYGQSVETTIATLEQLSKVGIKGLQAGQQAGITIREIFQKGTSDKFSPMFKAAGISLRDAHGRARDFGLVIADVTRAVNRLGGPGSIKAIQLFKTLGLSDRSTNGLRALVQAEKDGTLSAASKHLRESNGLTATVQGFQQTSLAAQFKTFKHSVDALLIQAGEKSAGKLTDFFKSFNAGSTLAIIATNAFKGLGDELGVLTDHLIALVSGNGLVQLGEGLKNLAVGTFKGLAGFGKAFGEAFGGKNMTGAEAFSQLLTNIGKASQDIFPKVGKALGEITKFLIDNKGILVPLGKAWLILTGIIFGVRVVLLPLQVIISGLITVLPILTAVVADLSLALAANPIALVIGGTAAAFLIFYKNSSLFRAGCQIISDSVVNAIPGLQQIADLLGFVATKAGLFGSAAAITDKTTIAFGKFRDSHPDMTPTQLRDAFRKLNAEIIGTQGAIEGVNKATKDAKPKRGAIQGPLLGGRDQGVKKLNEILKAFDLPDPAAERAAKKAERERQARMKGIARSAQSAQDKITSSLKSTNRELDKTDKARKNALKTWFEGVSRAADKAKQDVADFGNQITESLIGNLDPLKAQGQINTSLDALFKTLRQNMGVLAGSDAERARTNLDALSSALSAIGDAAKGVATTQGPAAVGGFLSTQIGTLLARAQAAFTSGQISADQLKQLQDQANTSLAAAGQVKIPVALQAVDADGNAITDPRKNGVIAKFDALHAELATRSKRLALSLGKSALPSGKALVVGFTDGVKAEWTGTTRPYLSALGKQIPNGIGGQLVLQKRMTPHGEAIMLGLHQGMKTVWQRDVTKFIHNVAPWIAANKGPVATDATLLTTHGTAIMGGLLDGLQAGWVQVQTFIKSIAETIKDAAAGIGDAFGSIIGGGSGGNGKFHGKFDKIINAQAKKYRSMKERELRRQAAGRVPKPPERAGGIHMPKFEPVKEG